MGSSGARLGQLSPRTSAQVRLQRVRPFPRAAPSPQCRPSPGSPRPARAALLGCREAHPANPDGWEENQLPAFLIKTLCVVGGLFPLFPQLPSGAVPVPWIRFVCLPQAPLRSLSCLQEALAAVPSGMSVFPAAARCRCYAWLLQLPDSCPFAVISYPAGTLECILNRSHAEADQNPSVQLLAHSSVTADKAPATSRDLPHPH
ncbi:uncharacterized protein LOC113945806 isoform X2 [Corapipo altera]|uniref:uncharacterized protein LOC113945806 isoform X2 n=1 Tax=Corapipo altera TaxID=415028 RepID=UPI000FD69348|nr:uncharacterized protein LOC113945806 isoform X2 [Corapipo altera]